MKDIAYIKQRDTYSCGPVALINLFKWANYPASYKNIKEARAVLNTNRQGTDNTSILYALLSCDLINYRGCVYGKNILKDVENQLNLGGCIFASIDCKKYSHCFLIIGQTKTKFIVVNYRRDTKTVSYVGKKRLIKDAGFKDNFFHMVNKNE